MLVIHDAIQQDLEAAYIGDVLDYLKEQHAIALLDPAGVIEVERIEQLIYSLEHGTLGGKALLANNDKNQSEVAQAWEEVREQRPELFSGKT